MSEMKFKYTIQQYQSDAVESVVKVFSGQPFNDRIHYRMIRGMIRIAAACSALFLQRN